MMEQRKPKRTARKVDTVRDRNMYGDGEGLYSRVSSTGEESRVLRTVGYGKRRDEGLGGTSPVAQA